MKSGLLIFALALAAHAASAEPPKPSIIKIVHRYIAPNVAENSFAAKPKTLYIGGSTYARVEEEPDPALRIHGLMICSEPDIWMINLYGRQGRHIVDPGPTFVTHHLIMERGTPGDLAKLEFGQELDFFQQRHAARIDPQVIEGQRCEASELKQGNLRVVLCVREDTRKPFQLNVFKDEKLAYSVRYISYETDLPFDAALFKPPSDVTITEPKPNPNSVPF